MVVLGVTGNIGCGKSTVSGMFQNLGAIIIDADRISHDCLQEHRVLIENRLSKFGLSLKNSPVVDRKRISKIVFNNKNALDELCKVLHPCIVENIHIKLDKIKNVNPKAIVAIDCALLFEMGLEEIVDYILVVNTSLNVRISRLKEEGFNKEQVIKRDSLQLAQKDKVNRADFVIDNGNSLNVTEKQVRKVWNRLKQTTDIRHQTSDS